MEVVKITVLKRTVNDELAKEMTGKGVKPCEIFKDGQEFITGYSMPEGFCEWAWSDISRMFLAINTGGNYSINNLSFDETNNRLMFSDASQNGVFEVKL